MSHHARSRIAATALVSGVALVVGLPGVARADWTPADSTSAVSVNSAGVPSGGAAPSLSRTGRYVAYTSHGRVLVRDRLSGRVTDVAAGSAPLLSASGKVVSFSTFARLTAADKDSYSDVYVRDLVTGTTTLASVLPAGLPDRGNPIMNDALSGNGRFVVFQMFTAEYGGADTDVIFVRDLQAGTTETGDAEPGGGPFRVSAGAVSISADGRYLAFWGDDEAGPLPIGIWVRDRTAKTSTFVSTADATATSISDNGRYIAFSSEDAGLVKGDTNGVSDVFVLDRTAKTTTRVSVFPSGGQAAKASGDPRMSGDGRYVVFRTAAALTSGDSNGVADVYLRDRTLATTVRLSVATGGATANAATEAPVISPDGRHVAFTSTASNLVAGDTNGAADVFVRDMFGD